MRKFSLSVILVLLIFSAIAQSSVIATADSLYTLGDYTKAINEYSKTNSVSAWLQIARSYNAIGNFDKAIAQYTFVTTEYPEVQLAHFEMGKLLLKVNKYVRAKEVFSSLVESNVLNPEYQYYLGEVNRELEEPELSLVYYKKAIVIDSCHLRSLFQLGKYYTIKQEQNTALIYVEKGLNFYENDVSLINLKALILYNDFQYKNAIPWFERLLELGEDKDYVYEKLAVCYKMNWEFEKSKKAYTILLNRDDTNSQTYFNLASVYQKENKLDSAKVFINKAMEVQKPIFATAYNRLADIARQQDDFKLALEYYQIAHKEDTTDVRIFYNICTLYDQIGTDSKKKLEYYERFLDRYPNEHRYFYETVGKRIRELQEQIHFSKD